MGIQHKSDQAAVPAAGVVLEKLYRDAAFTRYDVFAVDALDPASWAKQAVPIAGDALIDISPADGADATFSVPPASFDGGFRFTGSSPAGQALSLPASCRPAATSRGNIALLWLYIDSTANAQSPAGWGRAGPTQMNWGLYNANNGSNRQVVVFGDGISGTASLPVAGLYLFAMGRCEDGSGGFLSKRAVFRADTGASAYSASAASGATAFQPAAGSVSRIGTNDTFGPSSPTFRFFRMRFLDVLDTAGVMTSAYFDAVVANELALNRQRPDWIIV